jgi:hypothetical protein
MAARAAAVLGAVFLMAGLPHKPAQPAVQAMVMLAVLL